MDARTLPGRNRAGLLDDAVGVSAEGWVPGLPADRLVVLI
jgi:hypothetical protein